MRDSIVNLVSQTIVHKYDLPNADLNISRTIYSIANDRCFEATNHEHLAEIIYNAVIEYAFNEFEMQSNDLDSLHSRALINRLKYNADADEDAQRKYGFFGEVALFALLSVLFDATPLIARGHFYNPLENSETKGYDAYHLIEIGDKKELWFGEVKFYGRYKPGIDDVFEKIERALSDDYLARNVYAIANHRTTLNVQGSALEGIIDDWLEDPSVVILDELKNRGIELVYPVLLLYDQEAGGYDASVRGVIEYIETQHAGVNLTLSVPYSIFFILLPVQTARMIKNQVLEWIVSKKSLRP